jgi:type IV secretion system protein VirB5
MTFRRILLACIVALHPAPAAAQMIVHDPAAVGQLIAQAQTALSQLERLREQVSQAKQLYDSLNNISDVNSLASSLLSPELQTLLPELGDLEAAAQGDLAALGELAGRVRAIRDQTLIYSPARGGAPDLDASGERIARDLAVSETVEALAAARATGLQDLRQAVGSAPSPRAVLDLQARLTAELALIQNDQMRLQGLAMAQAAEARLEAQRQQEQARLRRDEAKAFFEGALP